MKLSAPLISLPASRAVTGTAPALLAASRAARLLSGRVKLTLIGSSWVIVVSAVAGDTRLPAYTPMAPTRPLSGARSVA